MAKDDVYFRCLQRSRIKLIILGIVLDFIISTLNKSSFPLETNGTTLVVKANTAMLVTGAAIRATTCRTGFHIGWPLDFGPNMCE
ncbi:hypothetical protein C2857_002632 [Epichloe festucae Fl1]|uniref:Uncharacterized protein n=1 Tax=Epichloe festucae (strain Fl1) TaxID=877507 RepID=A0A7U3SNV5_EPIFF|nr:hypothetical protein C2857_002632 [Epichloe festucae Fl1]